MREEGDAFLENLLIFKKHLPPPVVLLLTDSYEASSNLCMKKGPRDGPFVCLRMLDLLLTDRLYFR